VSNVALWSFIACRAYPELNRLAFTTTLSVVLGLATSSARLLSAPCLPSIARCRPDAAQVATDLLAFASTLTKQRATSMPQPDIALLGQQSNGLRQPGAVCVQERSASVPQPAVALAEQRLGGMCREQNATPTTGQRSSNLPQ